MMERIGILGGGSWSTAIAHQLSKSFSMTLYVRKSDQAASINDSHINHRYFPQVTLKDGIRATTDLQACIADKTLIVLGIPTQHLREVLAETRGKIASDTLLVNISKGIEVSTGKRISEIVAEFYPDNPFAVLSGPTHAEEVIADMPTAIVAASTSEEVAKRVQNVFMTESFRVYTNTDLVSVELGGAVKNVLAIGLGIADGLNYGDNTKAALITRGMHELVKFGVKLGASKETLYGLSGLGDLIVTATSVHSRNYRAGRLIGRGYTVAEAEKEIAMVVEGFKTCKSVYRLSRDHQLSMPIAEEIYNVLYNGYDVTKSVDNLMLRDKKHEMH